MKFNEFESFVDSIRRGCINRLADMKGDDNTDEYNWYAAAHNELSGRFMSIQVEYYDDE